MSEVIYEGGGSGTLGVADAGDRIGGTGVDSTRTFEEGEDKLMPSRKMVKVPASRAAARARKAGKKGSKKC
jgi:hypothetical protein